MNKVQIWVKNITSDKELQNGTHELVCDTYCYGIRQMNRRITLSAREYLSVKQQGYFPD